MLRFPISGCCCRNGQATVFLRRGIAGCREALAACLGALLSGDFVVGRVIRPRPPRGVVSVPKVTSRVQHPVVLVMSTGGGVWWCEGGGQKMYG